MKLSQGRYGSLAGTLALCVLARATIALVASNTPTPVTRDDESVKPSANAVNQLVENSDFELRELQGWSLIAVGGKGELQREVAARNGETNSHSLRLAVMSPGERCGVSNRGGNGIRVIAGNWYDLTFQARAEKRENDRGYALTVSLESPDGQQVFARTTLPEVAGDWKGHTVALHCRVSNPEARITITMSEAGTVWLDDVSLVARATK